MSRDAFLSALGDRVDRAELALDRAGGQLPDPAREELARDLGRLLAGPEAAAFLAAPELPLAEDELRERLRDLVLDEVPDLLSTMPTAVPAAEDPEALARVLLLREVVLPELDLPLAAPAPPPLPPPLGKPRPMVSFAPLRAVLGVAVLVGVGLGRWPLGPGAVDRELPLPPVVDAEGMAPAWPFRLRLPDGREVAPRQVRVEAEAAGPMMEGLTTLVFPAGLALEGGAVVEAIPPRHAEVVAIRWRGEVAVRALPDPLRGYRRDQRMPAPEDLWYSWRRRASLPPREVGGPAEVEVIWRGTFRPDRTRQLEISLTGLPPLERLDVLARERRPTRAPVPGWLDEATPAPPPPPLAGTWLDLEAPGLVRFPLAPLGPKQMVGEWRWGDRRVQWRVRGEDFRPGERPRIEWYVDGSTRGAPLAEARLAFLREAARWTARLQGEDFPARRLGEPGPAEPLEALVERLEREGFVGGEPALPPPGEEPGVRRVLVLQGPGLTYDQVATAASLGAVVLLGQAAVSSEVPWRFPVYAVDLVQDPAEAAREAWDQATLPEDLDPFETHGGDRLESLMGTPVARGPLAATREVSEDPGETWAQGDPEPIRRLRPCEPSQWPRSSSREPELIFGGERQDPASSGRMQVTAAQPDWVRRRGSHPEAPVPDSSNGDRFAWEQSLQAPRAVEAWGEVARRAEAWRRRDPRNPWPLLYLAEAAIHQGDLGVARRALGGVALVASDAETTRVALALALAGQDPALLEAVPEPGLDELSRGLYRARRRLVRDGAAAALPAYREVAEAAYLAGLAGEAPLAFAVSAQAEAQVVEARAAGGEVPGIFASLEPGGPEDCLGLRLLDRTGEDVSVADGVSRGGGRVTPGVAGPAAWARLSRPGEEVTLGVAPGTPGPDGAVRGVLVMLRPGRAGLDARLVVVGRGPARAIHREVLGRGEESR